MAASNVKEAKQKKYEMCMNAASIFFSYGAFDIYHATTNFAIDMQKMHAFIHPGYSNKPFKQKTFYVLRKGPLLTCISNGDYPRLDTIFNEHLDSIIASDPDNKKFTDLCEAHPITSNKYKPFKHCIGFNETTKTFKLTNAVRNSNIFKHKNFNINTHKKMIKYTSLLNIRTTMPMNVMPMHVREKNPVTSIICLFKHPDNSNEREKYALYVHHTDIRMTGIIINYIITILWPKIINDRIEEDCYKLHWLLAIACPFMRGSAGFAKVMLNAGLLICDIDPVRETPEYHAQTDWVAIVSPTFEEYYAKKNEMFTKDDMFMKDRDIARANTMEEVIDILTSKGLQGGYKRINKTIRKIRRTTSHKKKRSM